ncbi:Glucose-repressible alcohol dehydrogenase transcriptional effector [Wickerhamomyces ciferrii]|uniref:Glucose-repressible alcohol dehydrogenase transcriptional effector n=1 Tax=Wickerhamomyces ciferrii (strain ATCC 14091 / BCRC 22168 / CBS 111 / JCM 3599 / NBRC 0793 / NRRL Y-1031 F-60-10) TaxID=1206466 RepID=K0KQK8_WICCF|nr:Glucose-repressible alcohol dehydrogenase transcriptional effector [Wickerhamomyces ciferrii]CCH44437.1 Glucose-repressible alcohol dehydrogenase transcriptional effector [Wickerhamomyces ciferrii]
MLPAKLLALAAAVLASETIRLQNWNLRYDSKKDGISVDNTIKGLTWSIPNDAQVNYYSNSGEESWSKRRIGIANDVIFNKADIFNVNEGLKNQVDDLQYLLTQISGDEWKYVGKGRDDGKEKGEYEAIFYNTNKFKVNDYDTIWLSNSPFQPSQYPGAGSYRTATVAHMESTQGNKFTLINTHLDDKSDDQRKLGASMLKYIGAYEYVNSDGPVFLTGDFNSESEGDTSGAYKIATGGQKPVDVDSSFYNKYKTDISQSFTFGDLFSQTDPLHRSGHFATMDSFKPWGDKSALGGRIDFQFAGTPNSNAKNVPNKFHKARSHRVAETWYDNEFHLSDHRPVISDIQIAQ